MHIVLILNSFLDVVLASNTFGCLLLNGHPVLWVVPEVYDMKCTYSTALYSKNNGFGPFITYSTDWRVRSQKEAVQSGKLPSAWENCVPLTHLRVCRVRHTADGSPTSSLRLRLVLGTSFPRQAPNPMMPYGRQCSKTRNHARCACAHLEYNVVVWITAGWHTPCR